LTSLENTLLEKEMEMVQFADLLPPGNTPTVISVSDVINTLFLLASPATFALLQSFGWTCLPNQIVNTNPKTKGMTTAKKQQQTRFSDSNHYQDPSLKQALDF
jgi:hypothetical protein